MPCVSAQGVVRGRSGPQPGRPARGPAKGHDFFTPLMHALGRNSTHRTSRNSMHALDRSSRRQSGSGARSLNLSAGRWRRGVADSGGRAGAPRPRHAQAADDRRQPQGPVAGRVLPRGGDCRRGPGLPAGRRWAVRFSPHFITRLAILITCDYFDLSRVRPRRR